MSATHMKYWYIEVHNEHVQYDDTVFLSGIEITGIVYR